MNYRKLACVSHIRVTHDQLVTKSYLPTSVVSMRVVVDDDATVLDARNIFKKMEEDHSKIVHMLAHEADSVNYRFTPPRMMSPKDGLVFVSRSTLQGGDLFVSPLVTEATRLLREMGYDVSSTVEDWGH